MSDRTFVDSIAGEYLRYHALAEGAFAQLRDDELCAPPPGGGNSVAVIVWHVGGNFASRFTDFLTADGEKPWRRREEEFEDRQASRAELMAKWQAGWSPLAETLAALDDSDLTRTITIRGQQLSVHAALHRSLSHFAYHVGQIVFIAKAFRGDAWKSLSIPRGGSDAYNQAPTLDRPTSHAGAVRSRVADQ
jgi:uncharacterized damage-inducible protein DinB